MLLRIILVLGFLGTNAVFCQKIDYGNNKNAGKYYDVNGIKLYAEIYGKGEPLLLLHGNGGNMNGFSKTIPYFSRFYKVIAVDSRAQGKSIDNGNALTFEMMADDFAKLLDVLKLDSAYVIGWSDGGIDALVMAMRHPKKVKKLASTGANMRPDSLALLPEAWKDWQKTYFEKKDKVFTNEKEKNDFKVFALDVLEPNYAPEAMRNVTCPALIIAGDKDLIVAEHTVEIFKFIPKGQLWILPNTGHSTVIDRSEEFNRKVHDFFKQK